MGSGTLIQNFMGSMEPMELMLTQPLVPTRLLEPARLSGTQE